MLLPFATDPRPRRLALLLISAVCAACGGDSGTTSDDPGGQVDVDFTDTGEDTPAIEFTCDDEDAFSPNHSASTAFPIGPEGLAEADLYVCGGFDDYFSIELPAGGGLVVTIEFAHRLGDLDLYLFAEGDIDPEAAVAVSATAEDVEQLELTSEEGGRFILWIDGFEDSTGFYDLTTQRTCQVDNDCPCGPAGTCEPLQRCALRGRVCETATEPRCGDDRFEPNDQMSAPFPLFEANEGSIAVDAQMCGDDFDYYRLITTEVTDMTVELTFDQGNDLDLAMLDESGVVVAASVQEGSDFELLSLPTLAPGTYSLYVDSVAGGTSDIRYDLELRVDEGEPCATASDCSLAPGRGACDDGGCAPFQPESPQPLGEMCDSEDDCADDGASCFVGEAGLESNFCTGRCFGSDDCDYFEDGSCLAFSFSRRGYCFPGCQAESDCPSPYTCGADGACDFVGCGIDSDCEGSNQACQRTPFEDAGFCRAFEELACGDDDPDGSDRIADAVALDFENPTTGLTICNVDVDWFELEIPTGPAELEVSLTFVGNADLDVYVYDALGRSVAVGGTPDGNPEVARTELLAAGTYLVRVDQFPSQDGADPLTTYSIDVAFTEMAPCTDEGGECLGLQPLRIDCTDAGACVHLEGNGEVGLGELCDSHDDCSELADFCWLFSSDIGTNICTRACGVGDACGDVEGTECTPAGRGTAYCLP